MDPQHDSPYRAPFPVAEVVDWQEKPQVLFWFKAFCALMVLVYLSCVICGIILATNPDFTEEDRFMGIMLAVVGTPFTLLYAAGFFLPRKKWGWIFGIVLIGISMTSACFLPVAIPLIIYWVKAKPYFENASG